MNDELEPLDPVMPELEEDSTPTEQPNLSYSQGGAESRDGEDPPTTMAGEGDSHEETGVHLDQDSELVPLDAPTGPPPPPIYSKRGKLLRGSQSGLNKGGDFKPKWDWEPVRQDRIKHGWTTVQLAEKYGIPEGTIVKRAQREKWPTSAEVRKRNEVLATIGDRRATNEMFDQWVAKIRMDLGRNVDEILLEGPVRVSGLTMDEIKLKKEQISLLQAYQNLINTHQAQGARLRQLEREEYPAEHDTGKVDMLAMIAFHRSFPRESSSLQEVVVDVTTETLQRAKELDAINHTKLPLTSELTKLAKDTEKVFGVKRP